MDAAAESADGPGLVLAIDHVGLAVADLAEAVRFHTEVLGLRLLHTETNAEQGVEEAMLAVGDPAYGSQLQLLAPLRTDTPIGRFLDRNGPGLHHLAHRVRDVDRAASVLRNAGLRLLYDFAKPGTRGSRINFVHPKDAGGVLIELVETAESPSHGYDDPGGSSRPVTARHAGRDEA